MNGLACIYRTEGKNLSVLDLRKKIEIDYFIVTAVVDWKILKVYVQ